MKQILLIFSSLLILNLGFSNFSSDKEVIQMLQAKKPTKICRYAHEVGHSSYPSPEMSLACACES